MSNPEKDDEGLARKWLESQGYTDITRPCSDPPDYVVNSAYAVEVRRLNQRIEVDGRTEGEENSRKSLHRTIGRTLVEIDPPANDQNWVVDCKYDFSRPLPGVQVVKEQICEALRPLTQPYNTDVINQLRSKHLNHDKHRDELDFLSYLHLCLLCGICLELEPFDAHKPAKFLLPDVSGWEGIFVAHELINMGYPLHSGDPNILWLGSRGLGVPVGDDRSIRRWVHGHCLLHKAVEEFSPAA